MSKRLRRSMLFVPGNNPALIIDAAVFSPDSIILDLEDAVAVDQKDAARELVVRALQTLDFGKCELCVRINGRHTPFFADDIRALVPARPHALRLAMVESPEDIIYTDQFIDRCEREAGLPSGSVKLMASIETARGVTNAAKIAVASPRLVAISFGAEDFTHSIQSERTAQGQELLFARSAVVLAARAAGIDPIDTVYSNIDDEPGFRADVKAAKQLGFAGKSCVHPRQVAIVHDVYRPTSDEVYKAERVLAAYADALQKGTGVISVDGRMVDGPIVAKAQRIVDIARAAGSGRGVQV